MNGAAYFLVVNFIVAISFSTVFAVVATRSRSRISALWLAAGFAVASLSAICELLVAYTSTAKPWAIGAFSTVLAGMILLRIGIGGLYGKTLDWRLAGVYYSASIVLCYAIYDLPPGTPLQAVMYQSPFAFVLFDCGAIVLSSRRRLRIDRFLGVLLFATATHFLAKAGLAVAVGSGATAKDYIDSQYALISQSTTAVLMVGVGLTLLAALVLEIMAYQRVETEQDALSKLANRRGYDRAVQSVLTRSPTKTHALVLCDLDHFKRINDSHGHHIGDLVIEAFGKLLLTHAPSNAVLGRIGGEEFAIFLPDTAIEVALQVAQGLRVAAATMSEIPEKLSVTASFGVASLTSPSALADAYRQADAALYSAKEAGRNRVKLAERDDLAA